jgi:predicted transglutaminase-like cysteine proteinase
MIVLNRIPLNTTGLHNPTIDAWNDLARRIHDLSVPPKHPIWNVMLTFDNKGDDETMQLVNTYVNGLLFYSDRDVQSDYWASPSEILGLGKGDCVEYAVLKMWMLEQLRFEPIELDLWLCHIRQTTADHATLLVNGRHVLDSKSDGVHLKSELDPFYESKCLIGSAGYYSFPAEAPMPPITSV